MLEECKKAYEDLDYSKLARLCEEILKKDENNQKALTYLMYAYCDFGQYHLVLRTADKILRLNPKNSHPYNCKAMVHLVRGEYNKALLLADEGLKIADRLCLTYIHDTPEQADTFFPDFNKDEWSETFREDHECDEKHSHEYSFIDLERICK